MLQVGITGGIGSGKSTAAAIFRTMGIPVYDADSRAKALMEGSPELVQAIQFHFGEGMYDAEGRLQRAALAALVFPDQEKLKLLESLVHPAVFKDGLEWHQAQRDVPYTLKEAALLFESGSYLGLDYIIAVTAPQELRLQRVMQRDGATREAVLQRMDKQWPEEKKVRRSHFVLHNDGSRSLLKQVLAVHKELVRLSCPRSNY
jgi:dephospho-CoA kinase